MTNLPIKIRSYEPTIDKSYIYSSLLTQTQRIYQDHDANLIYASVRLLLNEIVRTSSILILCDENDENVILGYIIYQSPDILFYITIKKDFRRQHLATALMLAAFGEGFTKQPVYCAMWTRQIAKLIDKWNLIKRTSILIKMVQHTDQ